jgi:hypothetical protein
MKKLSITFGIILLVLGCVAFSPVAKADPPIVGLWQVHYNGACTDGFPQPPEFFTYQQVHSDGLEIETPSFTSGVCMGTWKQMGHIIQIYHVGWVPGGIPVPGFENIVRFVFTETLTVSHDRNSWDGNLEQTFYNGDGTIAATCTYATHATRISVP